MTSVAVVGHWKLGQPRAAFATVAPVLSTSSKPGNPSIVQGWLPWLVRVIDDEMDPAAPTDEPTEADSSLAAHVDAVAGAVVAVVDELGVEDVDVVGGLVVEVERMVVEVVELPREPEVVEVELPAVEPVPEEHEASRIPHATAARTRPTCRLLHTDFNDCSTPISRRILRLGRDHATYSHRPGRHRSRRHRRRHRIPWRASGG